MSAITRKRCSYDAGFKLKVVNYAILKNNNSEAAREFGIDQTNVRKWLKQIDNLQKHLMI